MDKEKRHCTSIIPQEVQFLKLQNVPKIKILKIKENHIVAECESNNQI
jgi:hypothetical protein